MNSTANLIRGVILSGGGMLIALAGGVVTLKLITNTPSLEESDIGIYVVLLTVSEFLLIICNLGMRAALPKMLGGAPQDERTRLIGASLWYQGASCVALLAIVLPVWLLLRNPGLISVNPMWLYAYPYLWVVPILVLASSYREVLLAILAGLHRYALRAGGPAVLTVTQLALIVILVWLLRGHVTVLLLTTVAAHAAAAVYLYAAMPQRVQPRRDWTAFRGVVVFAWPLHANALFGFVFQRLDTLFVGAMLGPAAAGLFELGAKKVPQYATGVLTAALVPYLPSLSERLARNDRAGAGRLLDQSYSVFAFLGYAAVFAVIVVREPLIRLLLSEEYLAGSGVLPWMMIASSLTLQSGVMGYTLVALNRPHVITAVNVGVAFVSVALNAWLIPRYGMMGAGYAAIVSGAASHILQSWYVRRSGLPLSVPVFLRPQVVFLVCVAPLAVFGGSGLLAVGCGLVFAMLAWITGLVSVEQAAKTLRALRGSV